MKKEKNAIFQVVKTAVIITLGVVLMFSFGGCSREKYNIYYYNSKNEFAGAKDSYTAGSKVTVWYKEEYIGTDTDYTFYLDGEELTARHVDGKGFEISFVMPEHDTVLEVYEECSMVRGEFEPKLLVDHYRKTTGTEDAGYYELVLYSAENPKLATLTEYVRADGDPKETSTSYLVPYEAVERCFRVIRQNKLRKWNDADGICTEGELTVCRFWTGREYIRVSTENMPEGGEAVLNDIGGIMREYLREEYLCRAEQDADEDTVCVEE